MKVCVLAFATLPDVLGGRSLLVDLPEGATVHDLLQHLANEHPALNKWLSVTRVAVNQEYVDADALLHDGDEVALIPPVSGG